LYDWLQAFSTVIEANEDEDDISSEIHARFARAVAELQLLGYVKPTKKKADTVARLTY